MDEDEDDGDLTSATLLIAISKKSQSQVLQVFARSFLQRRLIWTIGLPASFHRVQHGSIRLPGLLRLVPLSSVRAPVLKPRMRRYRGCTLGLGSRASTTRCAARRASSTTPTWPTGPPRPWEPMLKNCRFRRFYSQALLAKHHSSRGTRRSLGSDPLRGSAGSEARRRAGERDLALIRDGGKPGGGGGGSARRRHERIVTVRIAGSLNGRERAVYGGLVGVAE